MVDFVRNYVILLLTRQRKEKEHESLEKEIVKTPFTMQRRTLANLARNHPKLVSVLTGLTDSAQI